MHTSNAGLRGRVVCDSCPSTTTPGGLERGFFMYAGMFSQRLLPVVHQVGLGCGSRWWVEQGHWVKEEVVHQVG